MQPGAGDPRLRPDQSPQRARRIFDRIGRRARLGGMGRMGALLSGEKLLLVQWTTR